MRIDKVCIRLMTDIATWLSERGLSKYEKAFRDHDIDFDVLASLTEDEFKELGVSLGDRKRLRRALTETQTGAAAAPATSPPQFPVSAIAAPERRQLTVLFADLVASTALSRGLDPEDLRDLLAAYHQAVATTIRDAGGFVAKFMGDGVLAYFGYPTASEDAAERAVRAGLRIVAVLRTVRARDGRQLEARVGIATGPVVVGDVLGEDIAREINVVGETPNLAARLLNAGDPGSVVIAGPTRRLIGNLFALRDLSPQILKGFPEPVPVFEVVDERQGISRFEATRRSRGSAFVGRGQEAGLLLDRWQQACVGDDQLVMLSGEAGIGKSRITDSLWQAVAVEPQIRLRYQCTPHHTNSAFYPALTQLSTVAGLLPGDNAEALIKLATVLPEADAQQIALIALMLGYDTHDSTIDDLTPARKRQLVLDAFADQIAADCRRFPVLWVIEDAHWIDPTTEALISRVLDGAGRQRLMVVVTHRPEYRPPWGSHPMATALPLSRLSRTSSALLLQSLANGKPLPEEAAEYIASRADGVPLFMEELFKSMCDSGALVDGENRYELTRPLTGTEIPATLQDSLMARLDRLAPAKTVAQLGAAIGREFDLGLLLAISGLQPNAVAEGLEQLLGAGLLFSRQQGTTTTYIFKHALIQDAAYGSMLRQRRKEVHDRIARALIDGGSDQRPELIAHHFEAAAEVRDAAIWLERGGDVAFASASHKEALVLWRRALALVAPDNDGRRARIGLLQKLSAALLQDGYSSQEAFEAGEAALQAAIESGDSELYVRVCASNAPPHFARQDFERVERELAFVSSAQIEELPPIVRAQYYSIRGVCRFHAGYIADACKDLSAILDFKDDESRDSSFGGGDSRCSSMSYLARSQLIYGLPATARDLAHNALNRARAISHPYSIAWCLVTVTRNALVLGDYSEVLRTIRESIELCERYGFGSRLGQARAAHGIALVATGDPEGGAAELDSGLSLWRRTGNNFSLDMLLVEAANIFFRTGHIEQARRYVDQAKALYGEVAERTGYAEYLRMSGRILELHGDRLGAAAKYREAVAFADMQSANLHKLRACNDLACLLAGDGDHGAAEAVLAPALDWFTEGHDALDIAEARGQLQRIRSG
jgi:class 3 adenylate cyclase/tetratricopeptide (TPR) repeat protein